MITIKVKNQGKQPLPTYAHSSDSGMDARANIEEPITLRSLERRLIPTGLIFEIPEGYEVQVRPRSGLALKYGISVLNTPGTIDAGYRGEIGIILVNLSKDNYTILPGEKIAQLVLVKVEKANLELVEEFTNTTDRGSDGYGSTGTK